LFVFLIDLFNIKLDICDNNPNPCGVGAICSNDNGTVSCSCPAGTSGDPKLRCSDGNAVLYKFLF
jgi:hypothetical protein